MDKRSPADIERAKEQLRVRQAQLDPEGAATDHPWWVAARNSLIAFLLITVGGLERLLNYREFIGFVAWWAWFAIAGFVVLVCFGHATLGLVIGRRKAGNVLKILLVLLLFAIAIWVTQWNTGGRR